MCEPQNIIDEITGSTHNIKRPFEVIDDIIAEITGSTCKFQRVEVESVAGKHSLEQSETTESKKKRIRLHLGTIERDFLYRLLHNTHDATEAMLVKMKAMRDRQIKLDSSFPKLIADHPQRREERISEHERKQHDQVIRIKHIQYLESEKEKLHMEFMRLIKQGILEDDKKNGWTVDRKYGDYDTICQQNFDLYNQYLDGMGDNEREIFLEKIEKANIVYYHLQSFINQNEHVESGERDCWRVMCQAFYRKHPNCTIDHIRTEFLKQKQRGGFTFMIPDTI